MHTRMCRKYPITHVNIQEHLTYSNCHTPIYIPKKKTHFHAQSFAPNFTPNLYPKHLLSQTTYIHLNYTIQIFIVSLICIYMHIGKLSTSCTYLHSKGHSTLSYIHLGKQLFILGEEFYAPYIYTYIYTPLKSISHVT